MHPDVYRYLDDSIIQIITISDDARLKEAQEYLKRVRTRNLYPIVAMSSRGFEVSIEGVTVKSIEKVIKQRRKFLSFGATKYNLNILVTKQFQRNLLKLLLYPGGMKPRHYLTKSSNINATINYLLLINT